MHQVAQGRDAGDALVLGKHLVAQGIRLGDGALVFSGELVRHRGPIWASRQRAKGELKFRLRSMRAGTFEVVATTDTGRLRPGSCRSC